MISCTALRIASKKGGINRFTVNKWEGEENNQVSFEMRAVNHHLLETLHIEMKAGRTFSKAFNAERNKIIFNQAAIDFMGLQNLTVKQVRVENEEFEIIGVTQNFHFASLKENKQQLKEDLAVRFCVYNKGLSLVG